MANTPEVSVVIPTKDRWPMLSRIALPAALGQEDVDVEVIVVDDGSSDATGAELATLAAEDGRVRAVRHDHPRGVGAARNAGIAAAQGEWIAFLDDDDFWAPRKLRTQLDAARSESASFVYAGAVAVDETGRVLYSYPFPASAELRGKLLVSDVLPAGASNVAVRTDVLREVGGFDERFLQIEDWDLWIRLAAAGRPAAVPDVLVGALMHGRNKHASHDQSDEVERLVQKHASMTPPLHLLVDRRGHGRWVASQHSRAGMHRRAARLYLRSAVRYRNLGDVARAGDALLGKWPSSTVLRMHRETAHGVPTPAWLERAPYFDTPVAG